ncbi:thioesterase II family protein [Streptomyces sp. 1222.5]|uniref:thioesterase II family protein n=1 Tax=Streptomyces sp. 1222.5 TaxID=1881026 RepID=UPI003EB6C72E
MPGYVVPGTVGGESQYRKNGKIDSAARRRFARPARQASQIAFRRLSVSIRPAGSPWLPFGCAPDAAIRLLCLPHAGGGASIYQAWGAGSLDGVAVCPIQPPGREKRRRDPALTSAAELARLLAHEIIAQVRPPYALWGHSTGALVAFELSRQIRRLGDPPPVHLFVSGRPAPQLPMRLGKVSGLSVTELAAVLRHLGGTPQEVLDNENLLALIHPLLVADFKVNEEYAYQFEDPLAVPLTVFAATQDPVTTLDEAAAWKLQAGSEFQMHTLDGGHFAVFDKALEMHEHVAESLRSLL